MNGGTEVGRKRSGSEDKASKGRMQVSLLDDTVVAFDVEVGNSLLSILLSVCLQTAPWPWGM